MENQTNLRISIPKPCHEDWNKFTPDEKGAFCKVCSKSVHDFTKKSVEQISAILTQEISAGNKVCGRFNEDQLTPVKTQDIASPELSPYALNFTRIKKFALALFLVFGGFLFNSLRSSAQKMGKVAYTCRTPLKGEVQYTPPAPKDSVIAAKDTIPLMPVNKTPKNRKYPEIMGDVALEPEEKLQIMGGVKAFPVEETVVLGQAVVEHPIPVKALMGDTVITEDVVGLEEPMIMGLIAMPEVEEELLPAEIQPADSALLEIDGEFAVVESTFVETQEPQEEKVIQPEINPIKLDCYPNPSAGLVNIRYNVSGNVQTSILLYDMKGELVKTLVPSQNMHAADYSTRFDISDLPDGIYFCTLQSGSKTSTQRIVLGR